MTFTAPTHGSFIGTNSFTVSGTKDADSSVIVTGAVSGGASGQLCTVPSSADTAWSCQATAVPNGKKVTLTATETLYADGSTSASSITVDVLGAPSLDGAGAFVTPGIVSGGATTGNTVTVTVTSPSAEGCVSDVVNGYWSCSIRAPSGTYTVTAHQSWTRGDGQHSQESASQRVTIDKDRPAPPVVTSPRGNSRVVKQPVTYSGTGEPLGFLNVYIDASPVCGASVDSSGRWSCAASGISNGAHAVQAIQSDSAGNFSDPSAPLTVQYGAKPAPVAPPPRATTPATPSPTPAPERSATPPPAPYVPGSGAPPPSLQESLTNWGTPTTFGAHLPTFAQTVSHGNWALAPLLALGSILLIALPLRLLASTLRGRLRFPRAQFTGRNQLAAEPDDAPPPNPWLVGAIPLAAAAGLIVLSGGINGEVRFLRLLAAVGIGLAILNVVGVAIATRLSSRFQGVSGRLRFMPVLLVAAAAAALVSRWSGLEPPVVAGVLIGVGFARMTAAKQRAIVNLAEVGTIALVAVLAWLGHQWTGPTQGFWGNLSLELLATLCLAGLGSAIVLMLPLAQLPGRVILEWSPVAWIVAMVVVTTLAWVIVLGGSGAAFPVLGAFLLAVGFAALCLAVWAWVRYVEPASV
ncbi:DUF2339 domain-containing protein [Parafrigoribacterium soli]|uniref:hypothetical protein n=1 Tax=Parafrigoribacterium soli TaxID=3144663 RepID=UPI0032EFB801